MADFSQMSDSELEAFIADEESKTETPSFATMSDEDLEKFISEEEARETLADLEGKPTDLKAAEDKAIEDITKDKSTIDKLLIGAGRGLTDVADVGRQLFESSPLGGLTDETPESFRSSVKAERETFETGLGEDTAASVGRFVGQATPGLLVGGAAGLGVRGLAGKLATEGAFGGAVAGAAEQAGGSTQEILEGGAVGGVVGAVTGGALGKVAGSLKASGAKRLQDIKTKGKAKEVVEDIMQKFGGEGVVGAEAIKAAEEAVRAAAGGPPPKVFTIALKEVRDQLANLKKGGIESIGEVASNLPGALTGFALTGGSPAGALAGVAVQKAIPLIKPAIQQFGPTVGAGARIAAGEVIEKGTRATAAEVVVARKASKELTAKRQASREITNRPAVISQSQLVKDNLDNKNLKPFANALQASSDRGQNSLAATMHILTQKDPSFQIAIQKLEDEKKEAEELETQ